MKLKDGSVRLHGIRPELVFAIVAFNEMLNGKLTITSANDGKHSHTSLHYSGCAVDVRSRGLGLSEPQKADMASRLSSDLGPDFDVIYEGSGTPNAHFHMEYQPKRRP